MTDSDDAVVTEIIREIVKHGASAGVTFRQTVGGSTPARYPTEAVLTAVRMLAEAADADHSPMAAELRAMIEHVDPNLPIEIVYPGAGPVNCITETTSVHGLWWCYRHPENQPRDTLTTAIDMARDVAAQESPQERQDLPCGVNPGARAGCLRVRLRSSRRLQGRHRDHVRSEARKPIPRRTSPPYRNTIAGRRERGCGMDGIVLGDTLDSFRQKRFLTAERRAKGSELAAVSAVLLTTLPPRVARWG
jgi:hypothetical protein